MTGLTFDIRNVALVSFKSREKAIGLSDNVISFYSTKGNLPQNQTLIEFNVCLESRRAHAVMGRTQALRYLGRLIFKHNKLKSTFRISELVDGWACAPQLSLVILSARFSCGD